MIAMPRTTGKDVMLAIAAIAMGILLPLSFGALLMVSLSLKTAIMAAIAGGFVLMFALGMCVGARAAALKDAVASFEWPAERRQTPGAYPIAPMPGNAIQSSGLGSSSLPKLRRVS